MFVTVGAVAAGVNIVLHPATAVCQKLLKNQQSIFIALVIVEFAAIVKLLAGI